MTKAVSAAAPRLDFMSRINIGTDRLFHLQIPTVGSVI